MKKLLECPLSLLIFVICMGLAWPSGLLAAPGSCVTDSSGVVTCTGDQSQGIAGGTDFNTPPATTIEVNSLSGAITPTAGTSGIDFSNATGSSVIVKSGTPQDSVVITTQGNNASGIKAASRGSPSGSTFLPGLGVHVPAGSAGGAGPVSVESYGTIMTSGSNAHGISAQNTIGTYDPLVATSLQSFSMNNVAISLTSVSGAGANIGKPVAGDQGGLFTLNSNGTWSFAPDTLSSSLAVDQSIITTITYQVSIKSSSGMTPSTGSLAVCVTKASDGTLTTVPAIYFSDFGVYSDIASATPLWPALQGYVDNLLADMGAGGTGESLSVTNAGAITTTGSSSYGIYARAEGGKGATGTSGSFWNAWLIPTAGGGGSNGGSITVDHDGSISTTGAVSSGIVAESQGGEGGNGGNGSFWQQNGAQGGTGGTGGGISIGGSGSIHTTGESASGILAQSAGGEGGLGGSANTAGVGGAGGFGGTGGTVNVIGDWSITTEGDKAHGIWAKSLGGGAGSGGSGGWLVSRPGSGGDAADGGTVTVRSGGPISTQKDYAYGIYAQSIGGAGGAGAASFGLLWSYGGDASSAGSGGTVSVTNDTGASINTQGVGSYGIAAQSIGGGGGIGSNSTSLIISVGGKGGAGGLGGLVCVDNYGNITTGGDKARGISAQSIGGGGGDTGASYFGLISIGGLAEDASNGGNVTIQNSGSITTQGNSADAVYAESIGGGGGSGNSVIGAISVGGFGAGGGNGGIVTVTSSGSINTTKDLSRGIYAHSVGGGGGTGTGNYGVVAVGGSGTGSGTGGAVSADVSGDITTQGSFSDGIYAQSVGGGGGSGLADKFSNVKRALVSIGGTGTGGGKGGSVTVINSSEINTQGTSSKGIFAQSVGGGGGTTSATMSDIVTIGGTGGAGGAGGDVSVTHSGVITTQEAGSHGIEAQSIGGGGGASGFNFSLAVNVGGSNGSSGDGGKVTVDSTGSISTKGDGARGILAQSIGGSGGSIYTDDGTLDWENAVFDVGLLVSIGSKTLGSGNGGTVSVTNEGMITTEGRLSDGIYAQSNGGGGGTGSFIVGAAAVEVDLAVGDKAAGDGGAVTVINQGNVGTVGDSSHGIFAQSIGGGGGDGRFSFGVVSMSYDAFLGSEGSGAGGTVKVFNSGSITTQGEGSKGIIAQSVGGSGGIGTSVLSGSVGLQFGSSCSIGGAGGDGGAGGAVSVESTGDIWTEGMFSDGIFAQSIGGGGGTGGHSLAASLVASLIPFYTLNDTSSLGGSGGKGGGGGAVDVDHSGLIATQGDYARGIFAQSVGGGGGTGGTSINGSITVNTDFHRNIGIGGTGGDGGNGNTVDVTSSGNIDTQGNNAEGIFAQSVGGGGGSGGTSVLVRFERSMSISSIRGTEQIPTLEISGALTSSIGGTGGSGGTGGTVSATNTGGIATDGDNSSGLLVQSVGGGGGNGGTSVYINSAVKVLSAEIPTELQDLIPIPSASVSVSSSIGGSGGNGGAGGAATAENGGTIITEGDYSAGILAQSIGGGGGTGGYSTTVNTELSIVGVTVSIAPEIEVKYQSSVGGSGGSGGEGGNVTATNNGSIYAGGKMSDGIFVQSVGGGGGVGGSSTTVSEEKGLLDLALPPAVKIEISSSVGGTGGTGGLGGNVNVENNGWIKTAEAGSCGIFAQSVGGGGGKGGASMTTATEQSLAATTPAEISVKYEESIGGSGGSGGKGGTVSITGGGTVVTQGDGASGIFAQSVGGGGGAGGARIVGTTEQKLLTADIASMDVSVKSFLGGSGETGGEGGAVSVTGEADVTTSGNLSYGIFAQSVGGGGGAGGTSIDTGTEQGLLTIAPLELKVDYTAKVGGSAVSGGNGGTVTVDNDGNICTQGHLSAGIFAQSIGGGGGAGGISSSAEIEQTLLSLLLPSAEIGVSTSVGGTGGAGGHGGAVTVTHKGNIVTEGSLSSGILAQSIGGGGGEGGAYVNLNQELNILSDVPPKATITYSTTIGGQGGAAGNGGNVAVTGNTTINTFGAQSYGILAQSVGGGGGSGGSNVSAGLAQSLLTLEADAAQMSYVSNVGGTSGSAGTGGTVTVENSESIMTRGVYSTGIFAQSVGGGGGNGADVINLDVEQSILTATVGEVSVFELSYASSVGGNGSGGGAGGNVSVNNAGGIGTQNDYAKGILAQSVGGGGGSAGAYVSADLDAAYLEAESTQEFTSTLSLSIGGNGGAGGAGGTVNVISSGNILTVGSASSAIMAQSVGGGGGLAEYKVDVDLSIEGSPVNGMVNPGDLEITLGGTGGSAGNGGTVTVNQSGNIITGGIFSHGILAQSVGGGGGVVEILNPQGTTATSFGTNRQGVLTAIDGVGVSFAGSVGGSGSGGAVTVMNSGDIMTLGDYAHGIFAQSAGGTGAGAVSVTSSGDILAAGSGSIGILAQSAGGTGSGNIAITIQDGSVWGGSGSGAAISILNGSNNTLTNDGEMASVGGLDGHAVLGTSGSETIDNFGSITGIIDLGAGNNAFRNEEFATFIPGAVVNLGSGNQLTNAGLMSPGGSGTYQTTVLTGDYVQTNSGTLKMEISQDGRHDQLIVSGSASLDGTLSVAKDGGYAYKNGTIYSILQAADVGGAFGTINLPEAKPMLYFVVNQTMEAVEVEAVVPKASTMVTSPVDLPLADYLDRILPGATGDLSQVLSEFQNLSASQFGQAYAGMSPASYDHYTRLSFTAIRQYMASLQRRMNAVRLYANAAGRNRKSEPLLLAMAGSNEDLVEILSAGRRADAQKRHGFWFNGYRQWGDQDEQSGFPGYDYGVGGVTFGFDYTFPTNMMLGMSINIAEAGIDLDQYVGKGNIDNLTGAVYGSYFTRNTYLEGALSFGKNRYQNVRHLTIGSIQRTAYSEHDADVYSAYAGGGYFFDLGRWALGPIASLRYVYLNEGAYTETGAGSLNLTIERCRTKSLVSELGLRTAYTFRTPHGSLIPEVSGSLLYDFGIDDRMITASFTGSPDMSFSMAGQEVDKVGAAVDAGLTFTTNSRISMSLKYTGEFRSQYESHGIMGQLRIAF